MVLFANQIELGLRSMARVFCSSLFSGYMSCHPKQPMSMNEEPSKNKIALMTFLKKRVKKRAKKLKFKSEKKL